MATTNVKVVRNEDGTYRGPQPLTLAEKVTTNAKKARQSHQARWAIGTIKGVVIASVVSIAAGAVDAGARKALNHR